MTEHELEESLSALMDGELAPDEARRVLDAVLADPASRARWAAWQRVSAALAGQHPARAGDLAARVQSALENEPPLRVRTPPLATPSAPRRTRRAHRARRVLALAASVAALAVLVTMMAGRQSAPPESAPLAQAPGGGGAPATARDAGGPERMAWGDAGPGVSKRLNAYLLNHSDYLSDGVRGPLAYARVVGYDGTE